VTDMKNKYANKPLFLYESGIHAREWLSIATNIYIIDRVKINKIYLILSNAIIFLYI